MNEQDINLSLNRATGAYDQVLACVDEISRRYPAIFPRVAEGPMRSEGVVPAMEPGEWEAIRKLAQLGWAHFSVKVLSEWQAERDEGEGKGEK